MMRAGAACRRNLQSRHPRANTVKICQQRARCNSNLREDQLEDVFYSQCHSGSFTPPQGSANNWMTFAEAGVSPELARSLLESMIMTRVAHNVSRREALKGNVYYTIGPGGNESVCAVAAAMRTTDPSILHYRDTAFQFMRSSLAGLSAEESMMQMMRSYTCSSFDCNSGGRHKALGDLKLNLIPSTSTISSHYPRGIGMAASIPLVKRLNTPGAAFEPESIVMMSGGDASINHATFQTSVNFCRYTHLGRKMPLPALFLVSDNGYGISVPTPDHWTEQCLSSLGLPYEFACATQLPAVYAQALKVATSARKGVPSFLHLKTSRLFNHAGSDAGNYMNPKQIAWHTDRDPIPTAAFTLQQEGIMSAKEMEELYRHVHALAEDSLQKAMLEPKLTSVEEIMKPLVRDFHGQQQGVRSAIQKWALPKTRKRGMILKQQINAVLNEAMEEDQSVVIFGEDVADKGGNYGVTDGLKKKFGPMRVRDTLLDETSILGLALGFSLNGLTPIAEICYLAYIHNAIDQIRGEGATLPFFSNQQYKNGAVIRVAGGGLTEFGGHFHNENSLSPLLDMPGLVVMYPSNGPDYVRMFRTAVKLAKTEGRMVIVIEPIRLYAMRKFGNEEWAFSYPGENDVLEIGDFVAHEFDTKNDEISREGFIYRHSCSGNDRRLHTEKMPQLAVVSFGNGLTLSLEAAPQIRKELEKQGVGVNTSVAVFDQPWLASPPEKASGNPCHNDVLFEALSKYPCVLFADECRRQGCPSASMMSEFVLFCGSRSLPVPKIDIVAAANSLIPLGEAAKSPLLYLTVDSIAASALALCSPKVA